jgi:hypothetical protein
MTLAYSLSRGLTRTEQMRLAIIIFLYLSLAGIVHAENTCDAVVKLVTGRAKQLELWSTKAPSGEILTALRNSFIAATKVRRSTLPKDSDGMRELEAAADKAANQLEYLCAFWFFQKNRIEDGQALLSHLR